LELVGRLAVERVDALVGRIYSTIEAFRLIGDRH
jgi:hypothetical protein